MKGTGDGSLFSSFVETDSGAPLPKTYLFDPNSTWRRSWDLVIMLIVCFQALYTPFVI